MPHPESTLRQLVEQLEAQVRERESEIVEFERRAQVFRVSLKEEISRIRTRIELFRTEMDAMENEKRPSDPVQISSHRGAELLEQESQSERIRQAARGILSTSTGPMMQSEIKARMDDDGVVIIAKNVVELIRAALRRNPTEFAHIKGEGWILVRDSDKT
ncbi:hypothetical protein C8J31_104327 [Rhizobium sp. PP-CC-2G-626]|nr:hypothetical protein C8J31_104327 [Rhizobium sp. PP-CC-2G-626]